MMTDKEHYSTPTLMERDALYPTEPTTDDIIIRGEDAYSPSPEVNAPSVDTEISDTSEKEFDVDALFTSMFDEYVRVSNDPSVTVEVGTGRTDRFGNSIMRTADNQDVAGIKYDYLLKYVEGSIVSGDLAVSIDYLEGQQRVSITSLRDAYIKQGIIEAESRYYAAKEVAAAQQPQPVHIESLDVDPDPEATSRFVEVMVAAKEFGANVLSVFGVGQHFRSGPIPIHTKVLETSDTESK